MELRCHDNATTSGTPSRLKWLRERGRRLEGEVEEGGAKLIKVSSVQPYHMGRYMCVNNNTMEHSSIYVYVKGGYKRCYAETWRRLYVCPQQMKSLSLSPPPDPQNVFQRTIVNVILERAGENCIIPCLVTDPEVSHLALETCDGQPLPSGMKYHSNLQRGVIIHNVRKNYEGCYVCVGRLHGVKVVSSQYTVDVLLGKWELNNSTNLMLLYNDDIFWLNILMIMMLKRNKGLSKFYEGLFVIKLLWEFEFYNIR